MPITGLADFSAGAAMDWSAIASNLTEIRDYLNAVPAADVAGGAVSREHLVRPSIIGWPVEGYESGFQALYAMSYGPGAPYNWTNWGPLPERITIIPDATDEGSARAWKTPIGKTVVVEEQARLSAFLTAMMSVRINSDLVDAPDYPSFPEDELGGYLEMVVVNRQTGDVTGQTETRQTVYSIQVSQPVVMLMDQGADPGVYDVYLRYVRDSFDDGRWLQIDLSNIELTVEVL